MFGASGRTGRLVVEQAAGRSDTALATVRTEPEWTVLAAPYLRDDPPTGVVQTALDAKVAGRFLTRADLARCLIDALARPGWIGHVVSVANG